jgi:hypothetical protein
MLAGLLIAIGMQPSHAQQNAADAAAKIAKTNTIVVLRIDAQRLQVPELGDAANAEQPSRNAIEQWLQWMRSGSQWLRETVGGQHVLLTVDLPYSKLQTPIHLFVAANTDQQRKQITEGMDALSMGQPDVRDGFLVYQPFKDINKSSQQGVDWPADAKGGVYTEAFAPIADYPIQLVITPPDYLLRGYEELMPELPREFGGGPITCVTRGFRWAAVGVNPKTLEVQAVMQSESPDAAQKFADCLPNLLVGMSTLIPENELENAQFVAGMMIPLVQPRVEGDRVIVNIEGLAETAKGAFMLAQLGDSLLNEQENRSAQTKLKEIGLAIHNYAAANDTFPPAAKARDADGNSRLSWRVHLLPYVDQNDLYQKFHLDEAWDSPHNIKLLSEMPAIYRPANLNLINEPGAAKPGYTTYVAPVGEGTIFGGTETVTFGKITDGTSNTVMVVEVMPGAAVPWTAPQDYTFDPADPLAEIDTTRQNSFTALFGDGSVRNLPADVAAEKVVHLFQMNDGNVIDW